MNGSEVAEIAKLQKEAIVIEVDGKSYSPAVLSRVFHDPRPNALIVGGLQGIADYILQNVDEYNIGDLMIHIESHEEVSLITKIQGESNRRTVLVKAIIDSEIRTFGFDTFTNQEVFQIDLRSQIKQSYDRETLLKFISSVKSGKSVETSDDGVTQKVNVKAGISGHLGERSEAPAIVNLVPFRTFREVEQPCSDFLFRIRDGNQGPEFGLFQADGGAWKIDAVESIKKWFVSQKLKVSIIA